MAQPHWPGPLDATGPFITDGGLETTLISHHGLELPHFAACTLLEDPAGRRTLHEYYDSYAAIAREEQSV